MVRVSSHEDHALNAGWELTSLPAERALDPSALAQLPLDWQPAQVPGTVAGARRAAGQDVYRARVDADGCDHWYRCVFARPEGSAGARMQLVFDGLATIAEVWLNHERIADSSNMFLPLALDVSERLAARNELHVRFCALDRCLEQKRKRPRWRTRLVDHPQLRWVRTSLLGRMPGWSPPVHAVGPYRPVRLLVQHALALVDSDVRAALIGPARTIGELQVRLRLDASSARLERAELQVGDRRGPLAVESAAGEQIVFGRLEIPDVKRWWPHTHGEQPLYPVSVRVEAGGQAHVIALGRAGFRTIELDDAGGHFTLRVNGAPVFCRGACWTTTDAVTLDGSAEAVARDLERAHAAGMNMLRLSGTMFYESDAFYRRCDELGILVWQDFMFANQDYPVDDPAFAASVTAESSAFLARTQLSPSLALFCGGSEVEQQVAMLGLPRELWQSKLFTELLPAQVTALRPDVPYWPNSPSGGALPFEVSSGAAHYYGVGAYLRPLDDARRAELAFASECLAFANLPGEAAIAELLSDGQVPTQHPAWKARVPRDVGASWDFEDVRDHYLELLFRCDPLALRYEDLPRYLACSRVVTGEVMASALGEWRRARSSCRGALIWLYRDLWPGAGLGLLDAEGRPKAAYHYVQRALAKTAAWFTDEGLNGLALHIAHDGPDALEAELQIGLHHDAKGTVIATVAKAIRVLPHEVLELRVNALLPWFSDTTHAYRFGPAAHDLVVASLRAGEGEVLADAVYQPAGLSITASADIGLSAHAQLDATGHWQVRLRAERFAHAVELDIAGFEPEHNYLCVPPRAERTVRLRCAPGTPNERVPSGRVSALNAHKHAKLELAAASVPLESAEPERRESDGTVTARTAGESPARDRGGV